MKSLIDELKRKVIKTLRLSDVSPNDLDENAPLVGGPMGIDSIDTLELLVMLEKDYGVTIPDVKVGRTVFASVRSLATYIEKNRPKDDAS
jgi:acyl carrier protein